MQNISSDKPDDIPGDNTALPDEEASTALQSFFHDKVSPDDIEQVFLLKKAQPLLQAFTAVFHGGFNGVLVRLLVLRELVADTSSSTITRADINLKLSYLDSDSLETVLLRLRSNGLLAWDTVQSVYRVTPMARNILAAVDSLLVAANTPDDDADMGFLLSQVAGAQAVGGVSVEQLHHLLGRLIELTDEFRDAIASGSEFRLRTAQEKWHSACDWVEKGSAIIHAITTDSQADAMTHKAAQAIGRAQSALLNMQGMFSRALNQIERQRVHLGQSGLSTTDIKSWLLKHPDLSSLAEGAIDEPLSLLFVTPAEMVDVAESELLADRVVEVDHGLPQGEDAPITIDEAKVNAPQLEDWIARLDAIVNGITGAANDVGMPIANALLPANFAIASYRASLLPLLGDESEAVLQGGTATMARLPLDFTPEDVLLKVDDPHVAAISAGTLAHKPNSTNQVANTAPRHE
ncbi:uncharacterized protein with PIN domain [Herbaspirillum sp. Sphag1AN]|uniref:YbgA family protein n=1 Tax=unclassified Herbaspirillum TaxID=2624150 RepID=UPI00181DC923|nr:MULTISPECIES: YbgA family protein [unclassified Herbaspirillum]MBB3214430.1 uncharacterized protein with PIN domain [Herbaspirillum sp. Sphag1AN]MBB3247466.1 uncharacterized protein with PIN domain [Herbaspirillum sp. Sphag64]